VYLDAHTMIYCTFSSAKNSSSQFIEFTFYPEYEPTAAIQRKKLKQNATWYVTLTFLLACIQGGIHANNIANLFEQWYIPIMPIYACVQIMHLIAIKYLTLLMLNKLKNRQQPLLPIDHKHQHHIHTTKSQH
jgi:hypothetical protein